MTYAIQTNQLAKTYTAGKPLLGKKTNAVDGLSLHVPEGSIYGLLGRNSAGKTTTIRMAMGLARATSGSIEVFGLNPAVDPSRVDVLRQVGYVPEDKTLASALTPRKLFELNRGFYPATWSDAFARQLTERLELPLDTLYPKLSLGNKTKSGLITAMAQRSRLLILDEPTTGLDPSFSMSFSASSSKTAPRTDAPSSSPAISSAKSNRSPITSASWIEQASPRRPPRRHPRQLPPPLRHRLRAP